LRPRIWPARIRESHAIFSIDPFENLLYVSISDDSVQVFDTEAMQSLGSIGAGNFLGASVGSSRHTAIDSANRLLYYAVADSPIDSFSLDDFNVAGPTIASSSLVGAQPGPDRHIVFDPNSGLLWYSVSDSSVASIDPMTLLPGPTLASNLFSDAEGTDRIITMTYRVIPEPDASAAQGAALAALLLLLRVRQATK
jgi:hypothetical protein